MITHLVMFKPGASVSGESRRAILEMVRQVVSGSPTIRRCSVGRRVKHGVAGYEQTMREDYEYALLLEFDDVEGLKAYLTGAAHDAVGKLFTSASLAYDYEVMDLGEADRLL
ncbi:hypothetical protein BH24ACI4_BH24ACI4_02640 [soil metagenome]|nr:Dabb family protein [Acidobacteriota bacterium]